MSRSTYCKNEKIRWGGQSGGLVGGRGLVGSGIGLGGCEPRIEGIVKCT